MPVSPAPPVVNIAAYRFVTLDDLPRRRHELRELCRKLELKGTILLANEGINLFLAGSRSAVDGFLTELQRDEAFRGLDVKESPSDRQPFSRLLVKIKDEIIAFGIEGIDPRQATSPRIAPDELKRWLDEGRPVQLLDTRNDYEVELGTFRHARAIGIDHFRDFPAAVESLPESMKQQPVVTFCTGGIRCEKAAPFLERAGFRKVYQLDGGILKYFEDCGGEHYDGDCFVFDSRVAVNSELEETDAELCFVCQSALTPEDQHSEHYIPAVSCPHCYQTPGEHQAELLARRRAAIGQVTTPLPGSLPYENRRPINVPGRFAGQPLIDFLCEWHPHVPRDEWIAEIDSGRIEQEGFEPAVASQLVREGQRFDHLLPATIEPEVDTDIDVIYEDESVVVVNKPAPLPMHASGRFNRNTLEYILNKVYRPQKLRPAHRLDASTTGVVVLCRTRTVARVVQPQFERREVDKTYLARVHGHPADEEFDCNAAISEKPGEAGLRLIDPDGLPSKTTFRVLARLDDGTSVIESKPLTGRTNQIRLHLWHVDLPIVGDPFYLRRKQIGSNRTLDIEDSPLCLHAWKLTLTLPGDNAQTEFVAPPPGWASRPRNGNINP